MTEAIGVDIGGTGIKAAIVDLERGELSSERVRVPTPAGASPSAVLGAVAEVLEALGVTASDHPLGIAFPTIVKNGQTLSAGNISPEWVGYPAQRFFEEGLGRPVHLINDADAAGIAELRHGAARDVAGLTIVTTLGTGIGSAFLYDGILLPNVELGHLLHEGEPIELWTSYRAFEQQSLSWEEWASRLQFFYQRLERVFSPDLMLVGGGASKNPELFLPLIALNTPLLPTVHRNNSGIIGAAALAAD